MEYQNIINQSINYIDLKDFSELNFDSKNEKINNELSSLFKEFIETDNKSPQRSEIYDEIIKIQRGQLKTMETVGEILDIMKFSVKMLFVENCLNTSGILLLNEIFQLIPEQWEQDPVKVHLITKNICETLNHDFNNTMYVLNKIINFNRLAFYIACTLFWSLFLHHFKKDTHHYYKMYDVNKFFKLLQLHDKDEKSNKDLDLNSIFQLLMLISIYQNYVILSKENASSHHVFQDFFKVSPNDCERLKTYLSKVRTLIEIHYPVNTNQNTDALMLVEFLELDLIRSINQEGNQQSAIEANNDDVFDVGVVKEDEKEKHERQQDE